MLTPFQEISKIIQETKIDGLTKRIKSKPELWKIIEHWCRNYPSINGSEKIYLYYYQLVEKPICSCGSGKFLKFISFNSGYKQFCSGNCSSSWENRRKVVKENGKKFGLANDAAKTKQISTLQKSYGVINPSQLEKNRKKIRENNPMFRIEVKEKQRLSLQNRYGVNNSSRINWPIGLEENLNNKEFFEKEFFEKGPYALAEEYNIYYGVFLNRANQYGLRKAYESFDEKAIGEFLKELNVTFKKRCRTIIPPLELDFYIEDSNLAIEYCGLYWHGEGSGKNNQYHVEKLERCNKSGIQLITIFEDEWIEKSNICKNRIRSALKLSNKGPGARKLQVKEISPAIAADFLTQFHIQGKAQSNWRFGAYLNDTLVAVMTFSKSRISLGNVKNKIELIRYATDGGSYPGVASKLFNSFVQKYNPDTIISYCDKRWGTGSIYKILGFESIGDTQPNYWYFKSQKRYHRFNFRKSKLTNFPNYSNEKTEKEIMIEQRYDRIWDCGHSRWEWTAAS